MASTLRPRPSELDEEAFVAAYGGVYEHSPWVAREAYRRGLTPAEDDPEALATVMAAVLREAAAEAQLAVIRAHPVLGR
ncbi:MAG: 2-oxo-4-hydroxy-4-carboxy-5-ureidoimidazoline decarboxylase [Arhodomonas sp.]|nr:2-oxo-4-hydroxy-4-carboxy-5-ureidoimidazoline decarboxylase [Arhodomonas sp.]